MANGQLEYLGSTVELEKAAEGETLDTATWGQTLRGVRAYMYTLVGLTVKSAKCSCPLSPARTVVNSFFYTCDQNSCRVRFACENDCARGVSVREHLRVVRGSHVSPQQRVHVGVRRHSRLHCRIYSTTLPCACENKVSKC